MLNDIKIGVQHLQDQAREDLLKKVTKDNAVTEYFSKFVNSCVLHSPCVLVTHSTICSRHTLLLHTINGIVRKTRNAETDAVVRKKLVEPIADGPHIFAALELFLQSMIEENNERIIGHCSGCYRGYTVLCQPRNGRCSHCANQRRGRSW